jgi:hypothetical protein
MPTRKPTEVRLRFHQHVRAKRLRRQAKPCRRSGTRIQYAREPNRPCSPQDRFGSSDPSSDATLVTGLEPEQDADHLGPVDCRR